MYSGATKEGRDSLCGLNGCNYTVASLRHEPVQFRIMLTHLSMILIPQMISSDGCRLPYVNGIDSEFQNGVLVNKTIFNILLIRKRFERIQLQPAMSW